MKILPLIALMALVTSSSRAQEKLLSPDEFLGYSLGEKFTSHQEMLDYFSHVASAIPNAAIYHYGETYEQRPLVYLVVSAPQNFTALEEIRQDNLKRAGLVSGPPSGKQIAIVWLSYNVHGNEASSMEAAMQTLFELADPQNTKTAAWLKNTVVIMDPCMNPDGRERYVNFYNQNGNNPPNPDVDAFEHREPWPGGRANHYLSDLNRDWAWIAQAESRQRLKIYNEWLPHVHVDFHEQGYNYPYFFAPAAEPLHEVISDWQRDFQVIIGKNNARYFDERGWLYFTKEVFDLYYPSYGDTYPTYSGAIGMTYEQAGGGISGLNITTETNGELTLRERILHHHTSALSTIEVTSQNAERVIDEFQKYFTQNNTKPAAHYKTYVVKSGNGPDKIHALTTWMDAHAIRYGHPINSKISRGFSYKEQSVSPVRITTDDIIINIYQPKSRFITTVFEPSSHLSDSLTYDITAWNLMYARHLDAYALTEKLEVGKSYKQPVIDNTGIDARPYAYIFKYNSIKDVEMLSTLMLHGVQIRAAERSFKANGKTFDAGTLILTRKDNEGLSALDGLVHALARQHDRKIYTVSSGFVEAGRDLGSGHLKVLKQPRVGVLFGEQTSSLSAGEIWHFFEQQIHFPITQIGTQYVRSVNLEKFQVLVVPEGSYKLFDDPMLEKISAWVSGGGRLVLIGNALTPFVDKKDFALKQYATEAEKRAAELPGKQNPEKEGFVRYEEVERKQLSDNISGAIYKVQLDNSHPLGFGMDEVYYTLKNHKRRFAPLHNGWNVAYFKKDVKPLQGFAGFKANRALSNSLLLGVEKKGAGEIVYFVDNPLFRNFWENGKMLFANAVFMVGH